MLQTTIRAPRRTYRGMRVRDFAESNGRGGVFGGLVFRLFGGLHGEHDAVLVDRPKFRGHKRVQGIYSRQVGVLGERVPETDGGVVFACGRVIYIHAWKSTMGGEWVYAPSGGGSGSSCALSASSVSF